MTEVLGLLSGTEVHARGLRWEVVSGENLGQQTLFRLRGLENAVVGLMFHQAGAQTRGTKVR